MDAFHRSDTSRTQRPSTKLARVRIRLNEKAIREIEPPAKGNRIHYDDDVSGFGLRTTAAGAKSFVLNYVADGRERRITIGRWPAWSAMAARAKAKELRREVDGGADPLAEKTERRTEPTWADLVALYVRAECSKQRRGWEYKRILERETLAPWGRTRVRELRRRDVIALIETKAQAAPIAANRLFELIRRVCNFAVRRDLIEVNPCLQVRKPGVERSKDRVLSRDDLRVFWHGLDGKHFSKQTAAALRLILATAQRPGEVCSMRWTDVDLSAAVWTIPASDAKNALAHRVPLNEAALAILKALPRDRANVFPSSTGAGPIAPNTLSNALRKALVKPDPQRAAKLRRASRDPLPIDEPFTPHDLRRTAASFMASAGVQRFVIGQVLNHAEPGITRVYDRHGYDAEKRTALDAWDRLLCGIVKGEPERSNVVEIATGGAA